MAGNKYIGRKGGGRAVGESGSEKLLDFNKIKAIVWKNWVVMKSDRIRLIPMLIFPIVMITIFGYATMGLPRDLPTALVDYDHSPASQEFTSVLHGVNVVSIRYEVGTESEAKKLMDDGYVKAMVIIPSGFGDALETGGSQAKVTVKVDESDSSVAQMIKATLQQTVSAFSRQQAMADLAAINARQAAAAQALKQNAGALDSLSQQLSDDSALKNDGKTLYFIAALLKRDLLQADAQETVLKNKIGFIENIDNSQKSGGPAVSYDAELQQIAVLEARKAGDARALAGVNQLLAENAARAGANSGSATAMAGVGAAVAGYADSLEPVNVEVLAAPVAYDDEPAYGQGRKAIDFLLPSIIAMVVFQGATMGMGRALAGEKKDGSLTRVFLTPTSNATILSGTMLFYMLFESFRSSFLVFAAMILFGLTLKGSLLVTLFIIMVFASGCTAIGLLLSAITSSQEQYMAVSMLVSLPTMFLSGVFLPVQTMPQILQGIAGVLPVSYAATALRGVMIKGFDLATVAPQVAILVGFAAGFTALALVVFKREIA